MKLRIFMTLALLSGSILCTCPTFAMRESADEEDKGRGSVTVTAAASSTSTSLPEFLSDKDKKDLDEEDEKFRSFLKVALTLTEAARSHKPLEHFYVPKEVAAAFLDGVAVARLPKAMSQTKKQIHAYGSVFEENLKSYLRVLGQEREATTKPQQDDGGSKPEGSREILPRLERFSDILKFYQERLKNLEVMKQSLLEAKESLTILQTVPSKKETIEE